MERMEDLPGLAIGICQALSRRVRALTERVEQVSMNEGPQAGKGVPAAAETGRAAAGGVRADESGLG
jgi:hypothetical protein